ncbi:hypothetical protein STAFG_0081 [Streptomyces afghaniensis 772]|uniref:Uncharacterized protein n=1 Tax=Streptomyces afghaniensis 772 TaxID=1283301 RepID=S4MTK5_9ACTN|nr:hypothetical protein STAFG_0081 [Streptomyces afghaniensis 772]
MAATTMRDALDVELAPVILVPLLGTGRVRHPRKSRTTSSERLPGNAAWRW